MLPLRFGFQMSVLTLTLLVLTLPWVSIHAADDSGGGPIRKKLIELGWGGLTPARLLENLQAVEQTPFDGTALRIAGTDDEGKPVQAFMLGNPRPWKREWFQGEIDTLKKIKSQKLTDNFISVSLAVAPNDFADAFDDEGWKNIAGHFRIAAWIAKEGGLRGIMFDPESYSDTLISAKSRRHPEKSFEEYAAKVRQRGREVMTAIAQEYPGMVFFTLFMNSGGALGALGGDPRLLLSDTGHYSFYPAFVNGWLDAVPPGMVIVDGYEMSYPHSDEAQYLKQVNAIRNTELAFVTPENRLKYRGQVQAGLAIYMDAFTLFPKVDAHSDTFTDPPLKGKLVDRLRDAVSSAMDASDEYVWVYDEQYRWWPDAREPEKTRYWDEILPGTTEALKAASDPRERSRLRAEKEFAVTERKALARGVPLRNLAKNGDFNNGAANTARPDVIKLRSEITREPANDWRMTLANSQGVATRSVIGYAGYGSANLSGVAEGSFAQTLKAVAARFYKIRSWVRQIGAGEPSLRLTWQDEAGQPIGQPEVIASPFSPRDQWQQIDGTVEAPKNAATFLLELVAKGQRSEKDQIWFDDVEVYRIDVN